jgi:hypothetical protein
MNALFTFFAMAVLLLSPLLSKTIAAIDGTVAARLERHPRRLPARGTDGVKHLLASATHSAATHPATATGTTAGGLLCGAAGRTPLGLVREPELREPFLLAGREGERRPTIHTRQLLVAIHTLNPIKPLPPDIGGRWEITIENGFGRNQNHIEPKQPRMLHRQVPCEEKISLLPLTYLDLPGRQPYPAKSK